MSYNQRSDKNDTVQQYRKSGRSASFNQQRTSSGSYGKGGGGAPAHSSSFSSGNSRSFKKSSNSNVQGTQSRVNLPPPSNPNPNPNPPLESSSGPTPAPPRSVQNGAVHIQPQQRAGSTDAPITSTNAKPADSAAASQRIGRAVPKAPTSQSSSVNSDLTPPATPAKAPGDASKGFAFQFGSISPGFVNGMQLPARTSSAPPNLDEQKRDQARYDPTKVVPPVPVPPAPSKQEFQRKNLSSNAESTSGDVHSISKSKKDIQVQSGPAGNQSLKPSVHPVPGMSMQIPYHQPQVSLQFSGPNPQIQSQGMPATSLQVPLPMAMPMVPNASQMPQQMYVAHGMMHQGQALGFATQMGHQLNPQMGNMGIGIAQYPPQQGGKLSATRRTPVKIVDPGTHQEVRLDNKRAETYSDGGPSRSHPNVPPQSQPISSYPPGPHVSYYSNYNGSPIFFQPASSLPLTSTQMTPTSQVSRYNYAVNQSSHNVSVVSPQEVSAKTGVLTRPMVEPSKQEPGRNAHDVIPTGTSAVAPVTVRPATGSVGGNVRGATDKVELPKVSRPSEESTPKDSEACPGGSLMKPKLASDSSASNLSVTSKQNVASVESPVAPSMGSLEASAMALPPAEGRRRENLSGSNSMKDSAKKQGPRGSSQSIQVSEVAASSLPSETLNGRALEGQDSRPSTSATTEISGSVSKSAGESFHVPSDGAPNVSTVSGDGVWKGTAPVSSETSDRGMTIDQDKLGSSFVLEEQSNLKTADKKEGSGLHVDSKDHADIPPISSEPASMKISEIAGDVTEGSVKLERAPAVENCEVEKATRGLLEPSSDKDIGWAVDNTEMSMPSLKHSEKEDVTSQTIPSADVHVDKVSSSHLSTSRMGDIDRKAESISASISENLEIMSKNEKDGMECINSNAEPVQILGSKDKSATELHRSKSLTRAKKKRKEFLQKADAAGSTSDLYMAYKGPEEKKDTVVISESPRITSTSTKSKQVPTDSQHEDAATSEEGEIGKAEPDDWEDAADISTPKLDPTANVEQAHGLSMNVEDGNGYVAKKYSRDFLLKFAEKCTNLPENLEVAPDIPELFPNINSARPERDTHPSPRRVERQNTGPRLDRRGSNVADDDRWSKLPGPFGTGHDLRLDVSVAGNFGFRPGQGGVLRHPRAQTPTSYAGGILSGPMQALGSQGGIVRNNSDADRWQRAAFPQKGLIPSPQTPLQMMHKAEKKYQVGKVTDEEEAKQRKLKAILNKLTPQNFEKLFEEVKEVNIDNATTLRGLISQIFDKALMEPTFCEMYANLCSHLSQVLPDFSEENEKITFKRVLLNKCQEEFERGEREQEEANKVEEGEIRQTEEEMEEKRIKARRRMLGNIRLIGELYKKRMLTEKIMHECMKKLLGQSQTPHEEDLEALCKLMSTIGEMIDHSKAKGLMDAYFERMTMLSNNMSISSRVRFMLKDSIELRKNKWQQRRKVEGPKKIEEVHRDAAQERQAQASRLARTPGMNPSARRGMPMDFAPRGSTLLSSPSAQMGGFRGLPSQGRAFGSQDIRFEERQPYEARPLSVPLPQRSTGDEPITLGPQGGLGRGLSVRGPTSMSSTLVGDISSGPVDPRRIAGGFNGFSSMERIGHNLRDDPSARYMPDRFSGPAPYDQWNVQDRTMQGSRDLRSPENSFDRSAATSPATRGQGPAYSQNVPADMVWPEEKLRDMSIAAIKEFYSAKDEKEVALCIKDLNSPNFYPSMVSLWVTDSFERKDMERDLLAKLLINMTRSQDRLLSQGQLLKGFELVLATLEDAVNDAPKAPEFLGRIFAKVIIENVILLREIGQLLFEGGGEPGQLREIGLAADILGNTLEMIKLEKGETVLNEIRSNSNLRLEDFRPPDPFRSRILEKFI